MEKIAPRLSEDERDNGADENERDDDADETKETTIFDDKDNGDDGFHKSQESTVTVILTIDAKPNTDPGIPDFIKSKVLRYRTPISSSIIIAFMFGKPDTGNPIATEQINADP
ncbi:16468_t:CDS:2, partial [Dentiscutata heterogama]